MRLKGGILFIALGLTAQWARPAVEADQDMLPLHECRLEHPLQLTSIAARCGHCACRRIGLTRKDRPST